MRLTLSMAATCAAWALLASGAAAAGTLEVLVLDRDGKPTPDAVVIVTDHAGVDYPRVVEEANVVVDLRNALGRHGISNEKVWKL